MPDDLTDLRDAHLHLLWHGAEMSAAHLEHADSLADALERIAAFAAEAPAGAWIHGRGARVQAWPELRPPTHAELHEAVAGRPAVLTSIDHHSCVASTEALVAALVTRDTPDPPGGVIERDDNGSPTGLLLESACDLVTSVMPEPTERERLDQLGAAHDDLVGYGYTEVHEMMAQPDLPGLLRTLESRGQWDLTTRLYATAEALPSIVEHFKGADPESRIRMGGLKLLLDGALNARTAHMLYPYNDPIPDHPNGTPLVSPDELSKHFAFCNATHIDCACHAIGDAAVRTALDAYERIESPTFTLRIEHAQFVDEDDVARFAKLGVIASLQPCHLLTDIEATNRLIPFRARRTIPLRDLVDAARRHGLDPAAMVLLGSDTPVVTPDPADNIRAAVHRSRPDTDPLGPEQAITEEECLSLMRATA